MNWRRSLDWRSTYCFFTVTIIDRACRVLCILGQRCPDLRDAASSLLPQGRGGQGVAKVIGDVRGNVEKNFVCVSTRCGKTVFVWVRASGNFFLFFATPCQLTQRFLFSLSSSFDIYTPLSFFSCQTFFLSHVSLSHSYLLHQQQNKNNVPVNYLRRPFTAAVAKQDTKNWRYLEELTLVFWWQRRLDCKETLLWRLVNASEQRQQKKFLTKK